MSCATPILPSGPLGHVPVTIGHVAEIAGHDPETAGHLRPKYATCIEAWQVVAVMHSVDGTHGVREVISHRPGYVLRQRTFGFVEPGALVGNTATPRP